MDVQVIQYIDDSAPGVGRFDVGPAEEVIHADVVVVRQAVEDAHGDIQPTQLVVGISRLVDL